MGTPEMLGMSETLETSGIIGILETVETLGGGKGPGTYCTCMHLGTPEKSGVVGYYCVLSVYHP